MPFNYTPVRQRQSVHSVIPSLHYNRVLRLSSRELASTLECPPCTCTQFTTHRRARRPLFLVIRRLARSFTPPLSANCFGVAPSQQQHHNHHQITTAPAKGVVRPSFPLVVAFLSRQRRETRGWAQGCSVGVFRLSDTIEPGSGCTLSSCSKI